MLLPTREFRHLVILGFTLAFTYAYFFSGGGWNQASRFALVRALVENRSVTIDPFAESTGDKAHFNGHYYCDKAPGLSFLAVAPYAAARAGVRALGGDPTDEGTLAWLAWFATFMTSSIPTVFAALGCYVVAREMGGSERAACATSLAFAIGTPTLAYATLFWGHALAGACLLLAFTAVVSLRDAGLKAFAARGAATGFLLAWSVISEFPAAGAGVIIAAYGSLRAWRLGKAHGGAAFIAAGMGAAIPPIALLLIYQNQAFGSPFKLGYESVVGFEGMKSGLLGVTYPRPLALGELLVGARKGLLWLSPILVPALVGLAVGLRRTRALGVALVVFVFYLLLNASYHYWDGGWSYGPRILGAGIGFCCFGLAVVCDHQSRSIRALVAALLAASVAMSLMAVAVHPATPEDLQFPSLDHLPRAFFRGELATMDHSFFSSQRTPGWNLGMKMGLRGVMSLLPLFLVWCVAGGGLWLRLRRSAPSRMAAMKQ